MYMHLGVAEFTNSRYKVAIRAMSKALAGTAETVITTINGIKVTKREKKNQQHAVLIFLQEISFVKPRFKIAG